MGPVSPPAPPPAPSPRGFGRGTSSVSARRHRVVWSGTARSSPSRPMTEPISPSVCRYASRNTARSVRAVRIARSEYSGCPPRLVRRSASHASSENQTVKLPRRRRLSSYSRQFVTLRFCSGMWRRRSWFSLNGKAGIPGQTEGRPATPIALRAPPVGSLQQRDWRLIAMTVGVALVGIVTFGSLAGAMLPFLLRALRFDPASASAPLVATLVDVTGVMIYLSIAVLFLTGTLL